MTGLKIGIAIDGMSQPAWVVKAIEAINALPFAQVTYGVVVSPKFKASDPFLFSLYKSYDEKKPITVPDAFELKDIVLDKSVFSGDGEIDVLVNFSNAGLPLGIPQPKYGIWQYFFGQTGKADVFGIWEALEQHPVMLSGLEVTMPEGRRTIYRSFSLTDPVSIRASANRCFWKSSTFPARMLKVLHDDALKFQSINLTSLTHNSLKYSQPPSNVSFITAIAKSLTGRVINKLKRLGKHRDWILMYDDHHYEGKPFTINNFKELHAPDGYFWADPILIAKDGHTYLFVEEYVYAEAKGRISVIEISDEGHRSEAKPILDKPYHLSYPFVFEKDGRHYMIPESSANNTVELYECTEFPYKWEFKRNLLENVTAVDSTVLHYNDKWWLFANIEECAGGSTLDELFLFFADDIINSQLVPHPQNPIVSDVRCARPAGPLFLKNGVLFRPSQICAPYYGWGISLNRVKTLTEAEYKEEAVSVITPDTHKNIAGIHTLTFSGKLCVIDALKDLNK